MAQLVFAPSRSRRIGLQLIFTSLDRVSENALTMLRGVYAHIYLVNSMSGRTYSELESEGTIRLELLVVPWSPSMLLGSSGRRVWAKHGSESDNEAE